MNLPAWFEGLFTRAYAPAKQFVSGALLGAGIPRNLAEAKGVVAGFGEMLAGPTPGEQAQGPKPLISALKAAPQTIRENPAGAIGFSMGMAMGGLDPKDLGALKNASKLRKGASIEAEMHVLQEGAAAPLPNVVTREEHGAQMLQKARVDTGALERGLPAMAESMAGSPALQALPVGRTAMYGGARWIKTTRGWTRIGGKPMQRDFEWALKQHFDVAMEQPPELREILDDIKGSRPEVAVSEIKEAGGWGSLSTDTEARKVVARHIRQRIALGKAQTNEIVWLNLHDMKLKQQ